MPDDRRTATAPSTATIAAVGLAAAGEGAAVVGGQAFQPGLGLGDLAFHLGPAALRLGHQRGPAVRGLDGAGRGRGLALLPGLPLESRVPALVLGPH